MPFAPREEARIHYETTGTGPPLVLLPGLGYGPWCWRFQIPHLSRRFRVLAVDFRGIPPSTPLPRPSSMEEFAKDVLAVLRHAGAESAHVLGVSMGGFVAQALAALSPRSVKSLVLVSTSAGGPHSAPMPPETWQELAREIPQESPRDRLRRTMLLALTPDFAATRGPLLESLLDERLAAPVPREQWMHQALSAQGFDATRSDRAFPRPALVVAGTRDRVVPWTNSLQLYRLLPRASLLLFRDQNHLLFLERADELDEAVTEFLTRPPAPEEDGSVREVP